jgi:cytochrome c oxidase subunit II
MWFRFAVMTGLLFLLTGCSGQQSALDPQGPQAEHLANLFWIFTAVCAAIWLAVMIVLLTAMWRRAPMRADPLLLDKGQEQRKAIAVTGAVTGTLLTVISLTVLSFLSQRLLFAHDKPAVTIKITGQQWWWDVRYETDRPDQSVTTANEIYIPVGRPVAVKLTATDVIHSFWVPSLMGKLDLIPGQENQLQFTASRPGIYRGQCAEFCGWQHAHMGFVVVALPDAVFQVWLHAQSLPAAAPDDPERKKGAEIFVSKACFMCHTVRGQSAGSRVGPDLTHFASRQGIASATLPMSRGNVAAWVLDPQGIKPGTNMPNVALTPDELEALVSYLVGLR